MWCRSRVPLDCFVSSKNRVSMPVEPRAALWDSSVEKHREDFLCQTGDQLSRFAP